MLLYCEDFNEEQRGALVEIGMAYGCGKPVYAIGKCASIAPNEISDVAFTHFKNWTWLETTDLVEGADQAIAMHEGKQKAQRLVSMFKDFRTVGTVQSEVA